MQYKHTKPHHAITQLYTLAMLLPPLVPFDLFPEDMAANTTCLAVAHHA